MEIIKTEKLTKKYGKNRGITELDLSVNEGEIFGFIGPNGAGKSTTIRTLLGLIKPTSGSAQIFGEDITEDNLDILDNVGYMPGEASFYSGMSAKDIIKLSARLRGLDCRSEMKKLADRFDLDLNKKVDELSLGNRKKVSLICALQHEPDLYILDEPTSGLDPLMQKEFFDVLKERSDDGATVFLSSHVLPEIRRYCSRAAIIKEGRIIACDSVQSLARTTAKRVVLNNISYTPDLEGVRDVKIADGVTSFLYGGDMRQLAEFIASSRVTDYTVTEPDLEEIFLHYYEEVQR